MLREAPILKPNQFPPLQMNLSCQKTWHLMPDPLSKLADLENIETYEAA